MGMFTQVINCNWPFLAIFIKWGKYFSKNIYLRNPRTRLELAFILSARLDSQLTNSNFMNSDSGSKASLPPRMVPYPSRKSAQLLLFSREDSGTLHGWGFMIECLTNRSLMWKKQKSTFVVFNCSKLSERPKAKEIFGFLQKKTIKFLKHSS